MATFDLGRVTPLYKGDYSASASYELNDVVLYNGNLYWHIQATATVGILPTDTTVWKLAFADEGVRAEIRGYADNAQASADSALASKSAAATSASNASASASQAALSAQTASTKASEASTSAQTASTKASEASVSAQSAASSAQTATDKATLASQKAAAASESASLATAKANAAATSETNAAASAQTATAKASEAAASATSAQEYEESAQASAVNAQTAQGLAETAQAGAETAQGLAEDARDDAQEIVDGINAKASQIDANTASIVTLEEDCYKPYAVDTASGAVASFADGADGIPLKSLVVNIDPAQDTSSGDPSPENICPISGWTGANVTRCGKSFGELKPLAEWHKIRSYNIVNLNLPKDTQVYMSITDKDTSVDVSGYSLGFVDQNWDGTGNLIDYRWIVVNGTINQDRSNKPTSGKDIYLSGLMIYPGTDEAYNALFARYNIMIETSQSPTDYEPYNGTTTPIGWQTEAGTVYGGHLNVPSGVLTVDRVMVDLGTLNWTYDAPVFYTTGLVDSVKQPLVNTTPFLCSNYNAYPSTSRATMKSTAPNWSFTITSSGSTRNVVVKDSSYTNAATFKTAMDGVQLCYELATPITIQLTPHEVKSLLGTNNIFADTGDSSVEYRADTKMYIERLTEPDADMIADANITSGSYFMVGNTLYKATANIASGSAVIVGTNCTQKSLSEALNEINS